MRCQFKTKCEKKTDAEWYYRILNGVKEPKPLPNLTKLTIRNSNFDFCGTFLVNKHFSVVKDASDASGHETRAQMVLEHPSTDK